MEQVDQWQKAWGEGIVWIGSADMGRVLERARQFISKHYALDGTLLFFPTKAAERPFRPGNGRDLVVFCGAEFSSSGGWWLRSSAVDERSFRE